MTELEQRINEEINVLAPKSNTGSALSGIKKTLNSSSKIVDAVNTVGDNLQGGIKEGVGGITGSIYGRLAGKTTKMVGGMVGGIVSGTLKTVAGVIPGSSTLKQPVKDGKLAQCIDTYTLPSDKYQLLELLQFLHNTINSNYTEYGPITIAAFKRTLLKTQTAFGIAASEDKDLQKIAKPYMPKKKFGLF